MPFTSEQQKWIENFVNGTVREFQVPNMSRLSSFAGKYVHSYVASLLCNYVELK